jgi:sugar/nucleoside kinase (ribokinase family)
MVGTGGIGSGSFFALSGNETLGREESRGGRFLARKDYCKLHIVSHYVKALLGDAMSVFPIGRVGDDAAGALLLREMEEAGLDMRFVRTLSGVSTLFSFCLVYPDGSGGNLTTEDSASSRLGAGEVEEAGDIMSSLGRQGIALAVPEVPLAARAALLDMATAHGLFRAASFTTAEMDTVRKRGLLDRVDLLAVNAEEALAAAGSQHRAADGPAGSQQAVERAVAGIAAGHPRLMLSVTAGREGSWSWDTRQLRRDPALTVEVKSTAGAGDAHLAGILCALAAGFELADAQALGTLVAGASVTSPDTISRDVDARLLRALCGGKPGISPRLRALLDTAMS